MPLRFKSEAEYQAWVRESDRKAAAEERRGERRQASRSHKPGSHKAKTRRKGVIGHLTRPGARRRAGGALRTLLGPLG